MRSPPASRGRSGRGSRRDFSRWHRLTPEAANEAFSGFLAGRTLTANQISFVDLIVAHLIQNGVMKPMRLFDSPFSDIAPDPDKLFPPADVDRLVTILSSVRTTAAPTSEVA
ncbi:type I restriction-modification enzyme R subunit C-terminal domain-containing protein [Micromonospora sp. NPDC000207]|uniref:type I restriction-modification enzyme R subunit C-terminal domain-containing protein n=1 Tax=Micromonospora sp. NPDC000207 TaxID=3154246 RepID=UPI003332ACE3